MLPIAFLVGRLLLAAVFATAALLKALDGRATKTAIASFGAPMFADIGAVALPAVELLTALLLLPASTAWLGALAALSLLTVFTVAIAVNLAKGRTPDCNCFGQDPSSRVSRWTLLRNAALAVPALVLLAAGTGNQGPSAVAWMLDMRPAETALTAVCAVLAAGGGFALHSIRRLQRAQAELKETVTVLEHLFDAQERRSGESASVPLPASVTAPASLLPVGTLAPDFRLPTSSGALIGVADLVARGKRTLLLFVNRNCSPCHELLPKANEWADIFRDDVTVVAVAPGTAQDNEALVSQFPGLLFLHAGSTPVAAAYGATWTPGTLALDAYGHVSHEMAFGHDAGLLVMDRVVKAIDPARNRTQMAPPMVAITASGERLSGPDLWNSRGVALVFWRSSCPFCDALVADLRAWVERRPPLAPEVVLLVRARDHAPETFGLPVVVDETDAVAGPLDLTGTPSAVFIDPSGAVSFKVEGLPHVRGLLGIQEPAAVVAGASVS